MDPPRHGAPSPASCRATKHHLEDGVSQSPEKNKAVCVQETHESQGGHNNYLPEGAEVPGYAGLAQFEMPAGAEHDVGCGCAKLEASSGRIGR